jgi:DNA-binding MarR family transcriptional regulator
LTERGLHPTGTSNAAPPGQGPTLRGGLPSLELNPEEVALLRAFHRVLAIVPREVEADMLREHEANINDFLVLEQLAQAKGRRLKMSALADLTALTGSAIARIVARLEHRTWVLRTPCSEDRRASWAVLTPAGTTVLAQICAAYERSIRRHLLDLVHPKERDGLRAVLERVADVGSSATGPPVLAARKDEMAHGRACSAKPCLRRLVSASGSVSITWSRLRPNADPDRANSYGLADLLAPARL